MLPYKLCNDGAKLERQLTSLEQRRIMISYTTEVRFADY